MHLFSPHATQHNAVQCIHVLAQMSVDNDFVRMSAFRSSLTMSLHSVAVAARMFHVYDVRMVLRVCKCVSLSVFVVYFGHNVYSSFWRFYRFGFYQSYSGYRTQQTYRADALINTERQEKPHFRLFANMNQLCTCTCE